VSYKLNKPLIKSITNKTLSNRSSEIIKPKNEKSSPKLFPLITKNNFMNTFSSKLNPKPNKTIEYVNINSMLDNQDIAIELSNLEIQFPEYEYSKCSNKSVGVIKSYAVNTYQGIVRNDINVLTI
jgi:hypothetical protein